jgi:hypothetical protein
MLPVAAIVSIERKAIRPLNVMLYFEDTTAAQPGRLRLLRNVLIENKELVIGPAFTLVPQLFSLPYFIASLVLQCQNLQGHRLRYLLTVSYFTGFIPQLMSFFLYIWPSSFYMKEWRETKLYQWMTRTNGRQELTATTMMQTRNVTSRPR